MAGGQRSSMIRIFTVLTSLTLKMSGVDQIVALTGVSREVAEEALHAHKDDVVAAIDALLVTPSCPGTKHIPPKPEINRMMTKEQEERCLRGRMVTDKLNAEQTTAYRLAKKQVEQVSEAVASVTDQQTVSTSAPHAES